MFRPRLYKNFTEDVITIPDTLTTGTYTLSFTPDDNQCILAHLGAWNNTDITAQLRHHFCHLSRVGNTITAERDGTSGDLVVGFTCAEYYPGFIKSIQNCTIGITGAFTNTVAISAVGARAQIVTRGSLNNNTTGAGAEATGMLKLTSSTVVTGYKGVATGFIVLAGSIIDYK